jgi:hypothetical protein
MRDAVLSAVTSDDDDEKAEAYVDAFLELMNAYILAQYLLDLAFQNAIMDEVLKLGRIFKYYPPPRHALSLW